jgi:hypothetical protein
MVAAAIRTIFAQPTAAEVIDQLDKVIAMLADAGEDLTAFASFPRLRTGASSGAPIPWNG